MFLGRTYGLHAVLCCVLLTFITISTVPANSQSGATISGTILPTQYSAGATVALRNSSGTVAQVTVDPSGNYTFSGVAAGSYYIRPSKRGISFNPKRLRLTIAGASVSGQNFTATPSSYQITGSIPGATGATVGLSGTSTASTLVDVSGNYAFAGLVNGTYTVTPTASGATFTPSNRSVTINSANVSGVNFSVGTSSGNGAYAISGTISGGAGATVALTGTSTANVTADAGGNYTFSNLKNGTYTVTPTLSGYSITPPNQNVTVNGANLTGVNFTATAQSGTLSANPTSLAFGNVTVGSTASQNVTVTANGASITISQANVTGTGYSITGLAIPATIAAGQSATFAVQFTPTSTGTANGSVSLVSNASNTPTNITLSGTGATQQTSSGGPTLFFSDLTWGPNSGWEGSANKGAAVTIWGKNFGSTRGSSYVTVNGAQLTTDASYAEWDTIGPARGMERITFWVPSTAASGAGNITVTVNGTTSNALSFTVAPGTIYFIAPTGSNSNNGLYSTSQGGTNGPFLDLWKFNPCGSNDPSHTPGSCNPSGDGQYIVYVRAGTYSTQDPAGDSTFIDMRGPYGGPNKQKALVAYPGENPVVDTTSASRGVAWIACYDPYGEVSYMTFAKLTAKNGTAPFGTCGGSYNRFVGMTMQDYLDSAWAGVIQVTDSKHTSIYGNLFDHNGYDSYKHNIYIKTEYTGLTMTDYSTQYTDAGWNEFSNAVASDTHGGVIFISKSGDTQVANFPTDYVNIHDSYFHDGQVDFIYEGDSVDIGNNIFIYNNVFKGGTSSNGGLTFYNGTNNAYLYNNVIYQAGASNQALAWATGGAHLYMKNNIWVTQPGQPFFYLETFQGATVSYDHDLFFDASGQAPPSGSGYTQTSPVVGDPLFVNPASGDFHLQNGSPGIDAGTSGVNSVVKTDYDGTPRPQGNGYDIGIFER